MNEITMLGETEIKNTNFTNIKSQFPYRIQILIKYQYQTKDFKYFIGYKDGKQVRPSYEMLSKRSAYRRDFDETKYITFLIKK